MVITCLYFGCKSSAKNTDAKGISFFRFPPADDVDALLEWIRRCNLPKKGSPTDNARICSLHFHPDACPNATRPKPASHRLHLVPPSGLLPIPYDPPDDPLYVEPDLKSQLARLAQLHHKAKAQSVRMMQQRKILHRVRHRRYAYQKKVIELKAALKVWPAKVFISDEQLQQADPAAQALVRRFFDTVRPTATVSRLFPPELRDFALTLYQHSRPAYKYVRTKLGKCLPGLHRVHDWIVAERKGGEPASNGGPAEGKTAGHSKTVKGTAALSDVPQSLLQAKMAGDEIVVETENSAAIETTIEDNVIIEHLNYDDIIVYDDGTEMYVEF